MSRAKVTFTPAADRALARLYKADPKGVDQVMDSINLLLRDPQPAGVCPWGSDKFRMHVGAYRVLYQVISRKPVVIDIEHVGRSNKP
ncbi:type II toxin-antitoxin system RelE family toxin [Streptomyces sp. MS19]|uniref:type II toxin-antitoxin system RelE family toxin n=1 Tax=Streptomyces sp. MS19 TaxID=3385972 RepID=UPI00399F81C9